MKKFLSLLLAMIIVLGTVGVFAGCKKEETGEDAEKGEDAPKLSIIENGVSKYVIVYPEKPTAAETEAVNLLKDAIKEVTDVRIKSLSEEFQEEEADMKAIYVGNTTFAPAIEAKEELSEEYFDAYVMDSYEGDIYLVGVSDTAVLKAVTYYAENLLEKNYDAQSKTLYFEGCHFDGEVEAPIGFSVQNIREYAIVYDADGLNAQTLAKAVQESIKKSTGFAPDVYKDTDLDERKYEILVGETNRALSQRCYKDSSRIMESEYVVEKCKLQLVFGGCYSGQKCVDDFSFRILRNKEDYLQSGTYFQNDYAPVTQALTDGADVRIMSANVLAYRWGESSNANVLPAAQRAEIFVGVLLRYLPDATGIQETDQPWQQVLPWYLERMKEKDGIEYTWLFDTLTHEGKKMVNFSTIVYRSDIYRLDESGAEVFSIWEQTPNYFQRVATYVKLTDKTNPSKEFALVNTHWAHESREVVNACAVEQAALVNKLKAKYPGVNVFSTGDYNNLPISDKRDWADQYLDQYVADVGGKIASKVARTNGVLITAGGCRASVSKLNENVLRDLDNSFIDHVICAGGAYDIKRHDTIRDNKCHILSDHSPIYADIDLK